MPQLYGREIATGELAQVTGDTGWTQILSLLIQRQSLERVQQHQRAEIEQRKVVPHQARRMNSDNYRTKRHFFKENELDFYRTGY